MMPLQILFYVIDSILIYTANKNIIRRKVDKHSNQS
jgi:hypothetical protein